ncbi:MAG: ABC transporter substrate-binding protein [Alphaproteobacteria bacterium]
MAQKKLKFTLAALVASLSLHAAAEDNIFYWGSTTDPQTMDPYAVNTAPVWGFLTNVYEGLMRRTETGGVEPQLAKSWEPLSGEQPGWRFKLREGVNFHNGSPFNADDVIFSFQRATDENSDIRGMLASIKEVVKIDDYTIDLYTYEVDPVLPFSISGWAMFDKEWSEENNTTQPAREAENYATLHTNGTGPFMVEKRSPDVETTLVANPNWWNERTFNIDRAVFKPVADAATGAAGLTSGELDFFQPIALQDIDDINNRNGVHTVEGLEGRAIMLGFNHEADTLWGTDTPNPFKDQRVRQAVYKAIDTDAIIQKIMRGKAQPTSQIDAPVVNGYTQGLERLPYDIDAAKALLAEAGYTDGFEFTLRCPNDRYINDEDVCKAVVSLLGKINVKAKLDAIPVREYWGELRNDNFDMFLLGWTPDTFDAEHPIRYLVTTPNPELKFGDWNYGGYSNPRIDELLFAIRSELDQDKRQTLLDESAMIIRDDAAYIPLYVQPIAWGVRDGIEVKIRPDNYLHLKWVNKEKK